MKNLSLILILAFLLFLSSCAAQATEQQTADPAEALPISTIQASNSSPQTEASPEPTPAPTATPEPTVPTTIHIMADGSGDFASLADAVAAASADSTILLGPGIFHLDEALDIDKPLTLAGVSKELTILTGEGPVTVMRFSGEGLLTFQDMTVRRVGDYAAAVMVVLGGEVNFSNCRFTEGASNEDDSITGAGLIFLGSSSGVVENCEIDANMAQGILVTDTAKLELINNEIHDNGGVGIVYSLEENGGLAEANQLRSNSPQNGTDIFIAGSFAPDLINNRCSRESARFGSSEFGDQSGIMFLSREGRAGLPQNLKMQENSCAVTWCASESGSLILDLSCSSSR